MTFQAAVGMLLGCSADCCEAQSMVWPASSWLTCMGIVVVVDGVVGQQGQRELAALAGPQDAGRPAGGDGQHLGLCVKLFGSSGVLNRTLGLVDEMVRSGATMSLSVRWCRSFFFFFFFFFFFLGGGGGGGAAMCKPYPTDLTEEQWQVLQPLIPRQDGTAGRGGSEMREVVNTLFYQNRSGCPWDMLPHDLLPKSTAYDYFAQ